MTQTTLGHELLRPETRISLESGEQETGIKFDIAQPQEIVVLLTIKPKFSNDKNLQNEKYKNFNLRKFEFRSRKIKTLMIFLSQIKKSGNKN